MATLHGWFSGCLTGKLNIAIAYACLQLLVNDMAKWGLDHQKLP